MPRVVAALLALMMLMVSAVAAQTPSADLQGNIARLSALDYPTRMNAARAIRRAQAAEAVPALADAVRKHRDEFVRYRAFIVLSAFNDRGTAELVRGLLRDANDRLREAAYKWLEANPDPAMGPILLNALQTEEAEFVRPAVVSALAALGDDVRVQRALIGEIGRGLDFFRSAVIESLGRRRATYAFDGIAAVARLQGPLQDDAVIALGRIGGPKALTVIDSIAAGSPSPAMVVTLHAARCLAGQQCDTGIKAIVDAVSAPSVSAAVLRAGMSALTTVAADRNQEATAALVALGERGGVVRDHAAIGIGTVAVLAPEYMISWLGRIPPPSREPVITLLKDGFDDLEEDFGEEQFFAATRATYWKAADGTDARSMTSLLIQRLEF